MHENIRKTHAYTNSEVLGNENYKQMDDITQIVLDVVTEYNKILPISANFKRKNIDERLIKEAEEESDKLFLDEVLNIMQRGNVESDFFR